MHIHDLIDIDQLNWLNAEGYVREQSHPFEPLRILSYTDKAQIAPASLWRDQPGLQHLRGLIHNTRTGEIVARPFRKFWNYGQAGADQIELDEPVTVLDKVDGSLGIMYREPNSGQLAIATRGSFTSEQAIHATDVLRNWYNMTDHPMADDLTFLYEIVYPGNRIVLDYKGADDLFLLGAIDVETGHVYKPYQAGVFLDWYGPRAETLDHRTLAEALTAPTRPNREGMVIRTFGGRKMVKLKQEDYVTLHKLVFGLSERRVWQALVAGQTLTEIIEPLPDEFHSWVLQVGRRILSRATTWADKVRTTYYKIMDETDWQFLDAREAKKRFALTVKDDPDAWAYFQLFHGRGEDIEQRYLEKNLEPKGDLRPGNTHLEA